MTNRYDKIHSKYVLPHKTGEQLFVSRDLGKMSHKRHLVLHGKNSTLKISTE